MSRCDDKALTQRAAVPAYRGRGCLRRRDDRPQYQKMVEFVLAGGADLVVVQWLDRFGMPSTYAW